MKKVFIRVKLCLKKRYLRPVVFLSSFLLLTSALCAQVTVKAQDQSIRQILKSIEKSSEYRFFYNDDLSSLNQITSLSVSDMAIDNVMKKLLSDTNISYRKEKDNLIVLTLKSTDKENASKLQDKNIRKITGKVTDERGEAIIGANVILKGTNNGTITGLDGSFSLEVTSSSNKLEVSYIGYLSR